MLHWYQFTPKVQFCKVSQVIFNTIEIIQRVATAVFRSSMEAAAIWNRADAAAR